MDQAALLKRGLLLEYLTLGWNVVGVVLVVLAALAGFGLDSLIEIFASVVVVWQVTYFPTEWGGFYAVSRVGRVPPKSCW